VLVATTWISAAASWAETTPSGLPTSAISEERWAALTQPAPETIPAPDEAQYVLDPDQVGNASRGAGESFLGRNASPGTILDPNQVGNLDRRLAPFADEGLPRIRLSGFFQLDDGLFSQYAASRARLGDINDGVSFRRARLQAIGKLTEATNFSIEMDFALPGRPSFMDVWGEQENIPLFGTIRIGQFRQPGTMDSWTSVRHLEFLERSAAFTATDPFRRVGIMAYSMSDDERTAWAYSMYATGLTFWNGTDPVYSTIGDNINGAQVGDNGGVSFASRITHLLYDDRPRGDRDRPPLDRSLIHVGAGYGYSTVGGEGTTGPFARTFRSATFPEFFVGDLEGIGLTGAGTPLVVDTGRFLANSFNLYHLELAGASGPAHFQSEFIFQTINQLNSPVVFQPAAYVQCGYMLTGESIDYLNEAGVFDYNVVPFAPLLGTGRRGHMRGWGAWEIAARWTYLDLSGVNIRPSNILPAPQDTLPPSPNAGVLNETTVGINWWWNRFTRVQLNWIHSMPNYIGQGSAPFDIVGTRFQIEF
jgi:phosphate-selective porin OprO/OprP